MFMGERAMRHRNIAVLMTALDSRGQADMLRGIEKYAKDYECNIAVFNWFTGAFETEKHNLGEVNIANLPDLKLFDGVIVFGNALHIETNRKMIEALLEDLSCPIVCIGCKIRDYYTIQTDNYTAMRKLVEHFVFDHKVTDIHFVKGVEGNEDAAARYQAYEDVLKENNIPILPERISQGDFYVTGGEKAAEEIMNGVLPFPKAIVCANDVTAITISDILMENGYRIPEDVMISGYDYSVEAQTHYPRITSIRSQFYEIGVSACEILLKAADGMEVPKEFFMPDEVVLDESCGCQRNEADVDEKDARVIHGVAIAKRKMIHQLITLEKRFAACENIEDWLEAVRKFVLKVEVSEFYCCVNEGFTDKLFEMDVLEQEEMTLSQRISYSKTIYPIIAYKEGMFRTKNAFDSRYAFDELFRDSDECKMYIFSPLHYLERTFGYLVFVDSEFTIANQLFINWLIGMGNSIENMRKQSMLQNAMNRLDDMYVRDPLTGVYNRFGLERYFAEIKQKCMMSRIPMQLSFIDLDGLKGINDQFGHEMGDEIIAAAAHILQNSSDRYRVARYGGDEFIVIGTARDRKEVEEYWECVQQKVEEYNKKHTEEYLSMSFGCEVFNVEAKTSLDECIQTSDKKMYDVKRKKKEQRG